MLSAPCPNCGKALRLPLSTDRPVTCAACGESRELPPEVLEAIVVARRGLFNAPLRQRQLAAGERFLVTTGVRRKRVLGAFVVLAGILGMMEIVGLMRSADLRPILSDPDRRPELPLLPCLLVPFPVLVAAGIWARKRLLHAIDEARDALSARPAITPGSFECRLCGGPLAEVALERSIVRCPYCAGDNLLDGRTVRDAASAEISAYGDVEAGVDARLGAETRRDARRALWLISVAPALAVVLYCAGAAMDAHLRAERLPVSDAPDYLLSACPLDHDKAGHVTSLSVSLGRKGWRGPATCVANEVEAADLGLTLARGDSVYTALTRFIALKEIIGLVTMAPVWNGMAMERERALVTSVDTDGYGRVFFQVRPTFPASVPDRRPTYMGGFIQPWPESKAYWQRP